uniref:Immunoglobulin domain-containing protein n=1 Tax=Acanthochromis polyacanthus TaxID=80966 RepID=A0A3Q1GY82_9TELE
MEGRSAVWLLAALLLLLEALISAEEQNPPEYLEVGGKLVLQPKPSDSIRSITWKFKDGIVGEFNKETLPLEYSPAYKDRAKVDTTTGVLEISNMMKTDSGLYTVEINDRIQDEGYNVRVIKQVPEPTPRSDCWDWISAASRVSETYLYELFGLHLSFCDMNWTCVKHQYHSIFTTPTCQLMFSLCSFYCTVL